MNEAVNEDPRIGSSVSIYKIEKKLNEGGMGALYLGRHPALGSEVAIKIILPQLTKSINRRMFAERFFNEAKAAAALCTEWKRFDSTCNLVNVYDCGFLEDETPYMVQDYFPGQDLSQWLRKKQQQGSYVDFADVLSILAQTCCGLEAVHQAMIVHRDLSLGNLLIVPAYTNPIQVKILDFGIAKLSESPIEQTEKTNTSAFLGKYEYASPEQIQQSATVDLRADIYSLGVIAYRLLCYRKPYELDRARPLERPAIPHPCELRPEIPKPWGDLVMQMMAKEPTERPCSTLAIAHLLARTLPDEFGDGPAILKEVAPLLTVREWLDRSRKMLRPFPLKEIDTGADTKKRHQKGQTKTFSALAVASVPKTITTLESAASEHAPAENDAALLPTVPEPPQPVIQASQRRQQPQRLLWAGMGTAALTFAIIAIVGLMRDGSPATTRPAIAPETEIDAGTETTPTNAPLPDAGAERAQPDAAPQPTEPPNAKTTPRTRPKITKKTPTVEPKKTEPRLPENPKPQTKPPEEPKTKPLGTGLLD